MRIFIATDRDQCRDMMPPGMDHVVLVKGHNEPTGGFARPPATPTIGYARLHWAPARFRGIWVGFDTRGVPDPCRILLVNDKRTRATVEGCSVDASNLPAIVTLEGSDGAWVVSDVAYPAGRKAPAAATPPQEVADVLGSADQPGDDPAPDGPGGGDDASGGDADRSDPAIAGKPRSGRGKRRD